VVSELLGEGRIACENLEYALDDVVLKRHRLATSKAEA
jgi:hypothetical protein